MSMAENTSSLTVSRSRNDLRILVAAVTLLLVFIMAARTPLDTDFWWHIRAGEATWQFHTPLLTDQFTFTRMGQPWINHSWLAEVIYYLVFKAGSFWGVGLLVALLATGSMLLVYSQLEGPDLLKAVILILSSVVAAGVWSPRPQLFSVFLFAAVYLILYRYKWLKKGRLWVLPILFLLWSNLHAGFSLGFLLLGAFIAGELITGLLDPHRADRMPWPDLRKLILWSLVCALVVMINPNGLNTWLVQFNTVGVGTLRQAIDEWASPDFHQFGLQPFLWLLFAVLAAVGLSERKMDSVDLVGLIGFGYLAFLAKRNFAPFAIFATPILARYAWAAIQRWSEERQPKSDKLGLIKRMNQRFGEQQIPGSLRKAINLGIIAFLSIVGIGKLVYVTHPVFVESVMAKQYPVGAVHYLIDNHLSGRIFNSYGWGGFLEWNLRDSTFYIDGRTDLFGDEITGEWVKTIQAEDGWQDTLTHWQVQYVLIEPNRPLASALKITGTRILYEDPISILFETSN